MSKRRNIYIVLMALVTIILMGLSFGYITSTVGGQENNTVSLSNFNVDLITDISSVTINSNGSNKTYPMTDTEGLNNTPVTFAIKNTGSIIANYTVSLVDKETLSTLKNKDVRFRLKRQVGSGEQEILDIKTLPDSGLIDEGTIAVGTTITYELILWVSVDSTAANATFQKAILVEGMQIPNYIDNNYSDASGANYPELASNMIPVYYQAISDTEGVWKKASTKNTNNAYKWYDYDNQMWANAVTVKESGTQTRNYYLNAPEGTTIEMSDITTMWVWIPRFKYTIFNNNGTINEQTIDVTFEHGRDTTGTVKCHDEILTEDNSISSEVCTDTRGSIVNNKSSYTHPAFCFGTKNSDGSCNGEELTGFWMAKFEMSTDDATCNGTQNISNCNKTGLNILVKPNENSLKYESVSNMFANIRRMETYGNIHGFSQNKNATTWLDSNSNLTGDINNDTNNFDTHMLKNMEWGAVTYLANSKYGKRGNSDYTGSYKEIYLNNNSNYKTGYSGGSYDSGQSTSETYLYNNLTSNGTGQGYKGAGASTTGDVYGVFDMSGGTWDYVMANVSDSSGSLYPSSSGTWTSSNRLNQKYYDQYSKNYQKDGNLMVSKLGDAIREVKKDATTKNFWFTDEALAYSASYQSSESWFMRGASTVYYNDISRDSIGIFATDRYTGAGAYSNNQSYYTSRPVLAVFRDMPWKDNS